VAYDGRPGDFNMPEYPYPQTPTYLPHGTPLLNCCKTAGYVLVIGNGNIHSWLHEIGFD
jgi:choline-sulfatase